MLAKDQTAQHIFIECKWDRKKFLQHWG